MPSAPCSLISGRSSRISTLAETMIAALVDRDRQRFAQGVELDVDIVMLLLALAVFVLRLLGRD